MSKQQQTLQTQREPEVDTEIECPRCYDIMTSIGFPEFLVILIL